METIIPFLPNKKLKSSSCRPPSSIVRLLLSPPHHRENRGCETAFTSSPTLRHALYPAGPLSSSPLVSFATSSPSPPPSPVLDAPPTGHMSQPLQVRKSGRNAEPRRSYADEQAYHRFQAERDTEVARAIRAAQATVEPSDSDESDLASGDGSSSED